MMKKKKKKKQPLSLTHSLTSLFATPYTFEFRRLLSYFLLLPPLYFTLPACLPLLLSLARSSLTFSCVYTIWFRRHFSFPLSLSFIHTGNFNFHAECRHFAAKKAFCNTRKPWVMFRERRESSNERSKIKKEFKLKSALESPMLLCDILSLSLRSS